MTRNCVTINLRDQPQSATGASSYSTEFLLHATPLRRPPQKGPSGVKANMCGQRQQFKQLSIEDAETLEPQKSCSSSANDNIDYFSGPNTTRTNHLDLATVISPPASANTVATTRRLAHHPNRSPSPVCVPGDEKKSERIRLRLVEERFGDDRARLELSAVVIQRAFRRYQICKRFRTITDQLRRNTSSIQQPAGAVVAQLKQQCQQPTARSTMNTNESLVESLSQAANQLIANTKAAIFSATTNNHNRQQEFGNNAISRSTRTGRDAGLQLNQQQIFNPHGMRKASSSQQVNRLDQSARALSIHHVEAHRALLYRVGLNIFNRNPERGISYFIAHNFIENGPPASASPPNTRYFYLGGKNDEQPVLAPSSDATSPLLSARGHCGECLIEESVKRNVAEFLATRRGLSREKIGLYLGNLQEKFNQDVLIYYLQSMDFDGLQVDVGLRKFLQAFRLPGEAQKIERLVERFASRYVQNQSRRDNANVVDESGVACKIPLLNKDEIFILSFAIIMLNTDLHSPSLKPQSRMSPQQFVNNLRGLFKSQQIDETELIAIYQRIKTQQISTLPDHMVNLMSVQSRLTVSNHFQRKDLIPNLCQPHRRMVCYCRVYEVYDPQKKERVGQHQREIYLFNDMILICKLAKRTIQRATSAASNGSQESPLAYRDSFALTGLGVDLFQSAHYEFGIRLFDSSAPQTTLIMFNSVNKQDQVRFTRDLQDSIAEQHEMEEIKNKNLIDLLHLNFLERLRKHTMMHLRDHDSVQEIQDLDANGSRGGVGYANSSEKSGGGQQLIVGINNVNLPPTATKSMIDLRESGTLSHNSRDQQRLDFLNPTVRVATCINNDDPDVYNLDEVDDDGDQIVITTTPGASISSLLDQPRSTSSSGSSTSNGSTTCSNKPNQSSFQTTIIDKQATHTDQGKLKNTHSPMGSADPTGNLVAGPSGASSSGQQEASGNVHRKCSASSVFSHDSGLFVMSRDVSPNQSS